MSTLNRGRMLTLVVACGILIASCGMRLPGSNSASEDFSVRAARELSNSAIQPALRLPETLPGDLIGLSWTQTSGLYYVSLGLRDASYTLCYGSPAECTKFVGSVVRNVAGADVNDRPITVIYTRSGDGDTTQTGTSPGDERLLEFWKTVQFVPDPKWLTDLANQ